jgi:hypothetical protein
MADRFIRQSDFTNAVYLLDCPVALEKGAVLLDTNTDTYLLQLKLANIGTVDITSARVFIETFDSEGNPAYQGIYADYSEFTEIGGAFGTKKLLPLPNNTAVTFRVYVEGVITVNGDKLHYERSQYTIEHYTRDIAAIRERVYREYHDELDGNEKHINPCGVRNGIM